MNLANLMGMMSGAAGGDHGRCDCPKCTGERPKNLEEIRELLRANLRKLEGIVPLTPIPGHLYKTTNGKTVLVAKQADEDKDLILVDTETGKCATICWNGQPYYNDLGAVLRLGVEGLWILAEDLGEVVAMK